jgi:hypothetical protein
MINSSKKLLLLSTVFGRAKGPLTQMKKGRVQPTFVKSQSLGGRLDITPSHQLSTCTSGGPLERGGLQVALSA